MFLGGGLSGLANAGELAGGNRQLLVIFLDGGLSQLESWDPKPGTIEGGPFRAIPTSVPGTHISECARAGHRTSEQAHARTGGAPAHDRVGQAQDQAHSPDGGVDLRMPAVCQQLWPQRLQKLKQH